MNKPLSHHLVALFICAVTAVGCSSSPGPDAISSSGAGADCSGCHSIPQGARRQIMGAGGDFLGSGSSGTNVILSRHVSTIGDPTPAQCLVCHDLSNHGSRVVLLRNADGGPSIVYSAATPSSLEPFCLSCHDADGALATSLSGTASPFNDGVLLGSGQHVAGNKIKGYWTGSNNRHKTNGGLTCAGTGIAGTGCHGNGGAINMHGSVNKGLLTNSLTLGLVSAVASSASYTTDYKLCFDCHAGYPAVSPQVILGYKTGGNYDVSQVPLTSYSTPTASILSLFRDQFVSLGSGTPFYDDRLSFPTPYNYLPLHNYHLLSVVTNTVFFPNANWLSWKYRGDAAQAGRITCVTCHNVHGTNGLSNRSTYDELGITSAVSGTDQFGTIAANNFAAFPSPFESYPMNCAVDCHYLAGQTYYWNNTPAIE
jgi:hypothetical protein